MQRCGTCKYRNDKGYCTNLKLNESGYHDYPEDLDILMYSYTEGGGFYVGPMFGCVHQTEREVE